MIHSMQTIANTGSLPMVKKPVPAQGRDAILAANMLAASVVAYVIGQAGSWRGFAIEIIGLTTDGRTAYMATMRDWLKDMKKRNAASMAVDPENPTKDDSKAAAKRVASATVQISNLNTIAECFNGQGTIEGLCAFVATAQRVPPHTVSLGDCSFEMMRQYAVSMKTSKAGRTADTWCIKFAKWAEKNAPAADDIEGLAAFKAVIDAFNATQE